MSQETPTQGQTEIDPVTIIPIDENNWIIQQSHINFKITISLIGQRLKVLLKDNDEYKAPINFYTNSWNYAEMVDKHAFFKCFEDITYVEDIIKSIVDNPRKVSIEGKSDDSDIFLYLSLPTRYNSELVLDLKLLEKDEEEKQLEKEKIMKITEEKMRSLEQILFNCAMELKEITDKNNIKWNVNDFPEEIKTRCQNNWIKENPNRKIPWE